MGSVWSEQNEDICPSLKKSMIQLSNMKCFHRLAGTQEAIKIWKSKLQIGILSDLLYLKTSGPFLSMMGYLSSPELTISSLFFIQNCSHQHYLQLILEQWCIVSSLLQCRKKWINKYVEQQKQSQRVCNSIFFKTFSFPVFFPAHNSSCL